MLELVIVLVLLAIASSALFPSIISMLRSSTRSAAISGAAGDGRVAERFVEHDIRGAQAARSNGNRHDVTTPGASVISALDSSTATFHDVIRASPMLLSFYSETRLSTAGPELITLELQQDVDLCGDRGQDGRNWCLIRTVVGGGVTTSEVITRGRSAFPTTVPNSPCGSGSRIFCYRVSENVGGPGRYRWNVQWTPTSCSSTWTDLNMTFTPTGGDWIMNVVHNGFDPAVRIHRLDLITTIAVTLPTGGGFGATSERTFSTTELTLRSRQGEAYQQAIMCGAR